MFRINIAIATLTGTALAVYLAALAEHFLVAHTAEGLAPLDPIRLAAFLVAGAGIAWLTFCRMR